MAQQQCRFDFTDDRVLQRECLVVDIPTLCLRVAHEKKEIMSPWTSLFEKVGIGKAVSGDSY